MNVNRILVKENYGEQFERLYCRDTESLRSVRGVKRTNNATWISLSNFFMTVFLPHGYPHSVSDDYLQYQLWDSIQAFASSITGSISTHAILSGAGVGDETASSLAATIAWLMKDGVSMVGRIAFSWLHGTKLDSDCKKWRLFADALNDMALLLDLVSAYFKEHFVIIICLSGIAKSIVGVAGGATRAALTQHQARQNNMADVSAKDGSQETLVNLAALICSMIMLPVVTKNNSLIWLLYILMTIVHLLANYFAIKSVHMETFNTSRFLLYMQSYINSSMVYYSSVIDINQDENVFPLPRNDPVEIKLGVSFYDATKNKSIEATRKLLSLYKNSKYFLTLENLSPGKDTIYICLKNATVETQLEAMFHASFVRHLYCSVKNRKKEAFLFDQIISLYDEHDANSIFLEEFAKGLTEEHFERFLKQTEICGWRIDVVMFNADLWLVQW